MKFNVIVIEVGRCAWVMAEYTDVDLIPRVIVIFASFYCNLKIHMKQ